MLDFFKNKKKRRLAGTQVVEDFATYPIKFRTSYGGCRPTDYIETIKMRDLEDTLYKEIDEIMKCGLIDEYTNPNIFDSMITAYYKQIENEIERQYISFSDVIQSIRNVAKEELYYGKKQEEVLNEIITDENKKGKSYLYVELEK